MKKKTYKTYSKSQFIHMEARNVSKLCSINIYIVNCNRLRLTRVDRHFCNQVSNELENDKQDESREGSHPQRFVIEQSTYSRSSLAARRAFRERLICATRLGAARLGLAGAERLKALTYGSRSTIAGLRIPLRAHPF